VANTNLGARQHLGFLRALRGASVSLVCKDFEKAVSHEDHEGLTKDKEAKSILQFSAAAGQFKLRSQRFASQVA